MSHVESETQAPGGDAKEGAEERDSQGHPQAAESDIQGTGAAENELPSEPETELETAIREREEFRNLLQRAQADNKNIRRRHLSEMEASRRRSMAPLFDNLIRVLDHLEMALASPVTQEESKNLHFGVQLTRDQFFTALQEEGISEIPTDVPFDPSRHEALGSVTESDEPPGTIISVVRKGYLWGDQVLRAAGVQVVAEPESEDGASAESVGEADSERSIREAEAGGTRETAGGLDAGEGDTVDSEAP